MFVGREAILLELVGVLERAQARHGGARWIVGEAGMGKTALLQALEARAGPDTRVLRALGREGEAELAWGLLEQLLGPLIDEGLDATLPAPRRTAVRTALALEHGSPEDHSPLATVVGARDLLLAAAGEGALLVLVDDVQWADPPSRRALDHVLSRLDGTNVAVLVASRLDADGGIHVPVLSLPPLSEAAALDLLRGGGLVDATVGRRIVHELGGNPLLLHAALDGLDEHQRAGRAALPDVIAVPHSVGALAEQRLGRLDPGAREAVLVAAIAPAGDLRIVSMALDSLGHDTSAERPLLRAELAGVVHLGQGEVGFTHPTLRSAAYHLATPAERRRAHAAVAGAAGDEVVRAWHAGQAAVGTDEGVARRLGTAADELLRRRAPADAAAYFERASTLTADQGRAAAWLRRSAEAAERTGRREEALALLDRADTIAGDAGDPLEQARRERTRLRLTARSAGLDDVVDRMRELAEGVERLDATLAAEILLDCVPALVRSLRPADIEQVAKAAEALADQDGAVDLARRADVVLGGVRLARGELEGQADLDRYVEVLAEEGPVAAAPFLAEVVAPLLGLLRRGPDVDHLFDVLDGDLRTAVAIPALVTVLGARGILVRGRDLRRAVALDLEAIELADGIGQPELAMFAAGSLAMSAAVRGDAEHTTLAAERCTASADPNHHVAGIAGRAHLHLATGEIEAAIELYEGLYAGHGVGRSLVRWEPDWCEALARARDLDRAREMIDEFAGSPMGLLATGGVARVRGMLADEDDEAVEQFQHAFRFLDIIPNDIVRGRTELVWGERLRRSRRRAEARTHLARAEALLRGVGADVWADRAAHELVAAGAPASDRQGTAGALTGQERAAARLAMAGATNREIADRMYLSPRTIETHLGAAYRKLGVANRRELLIWASEGGTLDD